MPYVYVGLPSPYGGKPLFNILNNLKNFGIGRIVYRSTESQAPCKPSFYKILLAQPEMDDKNFFGRVVAEKVTNGIRTTTPVNLSYDVHIPDFRLLHKYEEESFCQWDKIRDYDFKKDAPIKPKYIQMPPGLLRLMKQSKLNKGESFDETSFKLPVYKIYEGDFQLEDRTETHKVSNFLKNEFTDYKDFNIERIPIDKWNEMRVPRPVGHRIYSNNIEGQGWEEREKRRKDLEEMEIKVKELNLE